MLQHRLTIFEYIVVLIILVTLLSIVHLCWLELARWINLAARIALSFVEIHLIHLLLDWWSRLEILLLRWHLQHWFMLLLHPIWVES
jgi:hypothetical protein